MYFVPIIWTSLRPGGGSCGFEIETLDDSDVTAKSCDVVDELPGTVSVESALTVLDESAATESVAGASAEELEESPNT
jgi:hypothetical protein